MAAALIRHERGVTPELRAFRRHLPTDPAMIDALVRGTTGLLILLDNAGVETSERPTDGTGTETAEKSGRHESGF